ncbi:glycerol kinase [Desulfuromusa kysingii]|uniref:ATP:glycerol 3-phosphotransferase n=1 Tax=Desulfuromusa kysingii TaxID=37625 RepID=A0A1H3ZYU1_9BACT|nr:FGGY family carbohydrate kinase [Desulfuromusa kysingii]SEA29053.1 glycerol kinase [Desulfuromusa kysingii]
MSILAIDQGTTSTHALLVGSSGIQTTAKTLEHQQFYPKAGWVEHDPEELIQNIRCCIDSCDDIQAIGIANQGESCLAWDADSKRAISPIIVWQDNRTQLTIDKLKSEKQQQRVLELSGLPLDTYFSATKLRWIIDNIPAAKELLQRGKLRLGTTDSFFLDRFTGHFATDISTASRTSLMNLHTGQWDEELCHIFGVPMEVLPEIVSTTGDFGAVESKGRVIPITASIVDQQAALYGHGCINNGDAKITFGTGAFALVVTGATPEQSPNQGLLPTVAWQLKGQPPIYALDGGIFSAGSAINWARSLGLFQEYSQIQHFETNSAIERDLAFVPALSGLGCPYWDRTAGGLWIGLSLHTRAADLVQSILEGIAFRAAEVINSMNEFVSIKEVISIDGGLAANPYLCQFLADVLSRQVTVQSSTELTAYGTACLAAEGEFEPYPIKDSTKKYLPQTNRDSQLLKFQTAVSRAADWRL